ncbi:MAG: hypothetical protein H7Z17_01745 [Fuerstia sp.]|nr:hypothetical protein [Fuerstiella sp.]
MSSALPRRIAMRSLSLRIAVVMFLLPSLRITSIHAGDDLSTVVPFEIPIIEGRALNLVGTNSCAAGSCHGGARLSEGRSFAAYQIWMRKDPHSTAYEVLNNERSSRMMALLYATENEPAPHATKEARCLNCHVTTESSGDLQLLPTTHAVTDGVGCESCHGPAKQWLGLHSTIAWRGLTAEAKSSLGFVDTTADLAGRAQLCASCHVGSPGRDVNHDLIAAGHPRLNFEFSAFHANLPKHWDPQSPRPTEIKDVEKDPAFEARAWLTGQLVTAQTSLRLLQHRTEADRPWPELSEYACFSCHHDLKESSWYQTRRKSKGQFAWGTWNYGAFPALSEDAVANGQFENLRQIMQGPSPDRDKVHHQAADLDLVLEKLIRQESSRDYSKHGLDQLALQMIVQSRKGDLPAESWDQTAQLYLAAVAISLARERTAAGDPRNLTIQNDLEAIRQELLFEDNVDSPRKYSGSQIEVILQRLHGIQETLTTADSVDR